MDHMDHWRQFLVSQGPKVDKYIHDGSHRTTIVDRVHYLRTLGAPSGATYDI